MNQQSIWQHVSTLKPKLRGHISLYAQIYRGERWYVLHDQSSEQFLRFNERAYAVLGRFDGVLTLEEILDYANVEHEEHPLTEGDVIGLLGQLDAAEVLQGGLPLNAQDLFVQYKAQKQKKRQSVFLNPLSIKVPLFDPDKFLIKLSPVARMLFSKTGFWIWMLTLLSAFFLGVAHIPELTKELIALEFSSTQLMTLWVIYPLVKALHELGHGLALKAWGGEVHETGINLLVFIPVPYVDATASWGFGSKWRRMAVGAAGIMVELFLASLALFLWLTVEPGLVKTAAFNVILIATVSTLLFNGNPLLKYDGYFVLEDFLEIPNLATRSKRYYYYLIQKYILKSPSAVDPVTAKGEEKWFLFYGFAAPVYRVLLLLSIALYLIDSFLMIGVALAVWAIVMQVVVPAFKGISFLAFSKAAAPYRSRGMIFLAFLLAGFVTLMSIPISVTTYTQGVVWTKGGGQVVAGTSGFVSEVLQSSNTDVIDGEPLFQLEDDELQAQYEILKHRLNELHIKKRGLEYTDRVEAAMVNDDLNSVIAEYKQYLEKFEKLSVKSESNGTFISADPNGFDGRYVHQGDLLGHIVNSKNIVIKAMIPQERMGLLESYETTVKFILVNDQKKVYESTIIRKTPQARTTLVSPALGRSGGGIFDVDTRDKSATKLLIPAFEIDMSLPESLEVSKIGSRVHVRLDHGKLPLIQQFSLSFQQLFLRHFYSQ